MTSSSLSFRSSSSLPVGSGFGRAGTGSGAGLCTEQQLEDTGAELEVWGIGRGKSCVKQGEGIILSTYCVPAPGIIC